MTPNTPVTMTHNRILCQKFPFYVIAMPRQLSNFEKLQIISKIDAGWSVRILAEEYNRSKTTIQNLKERWDNEQTVERRRGTGRSSITNEQQDANLVNFVRDHPFDCARRAKVETNFPASVTTALRRIRKTELKNCAAEKKYKLSQENKQGRIIFALNYLLNDVVNFWGRVIFSDEKVVQSYHYGHIRVYRPPRSRYEEKYISPSDKSGRFSVNVWAWMYRGGLGVSLTED